MSATTVDLKSERRDAVLFLTQIILPYDLAVQKLRIRDTYDWHQRVWEAFGGRDGEARDFLTRVDRMEEGYRLLVLSQSASEKPDWCPTDCFGSKPIPEGFFDHQHYRFSLVANATKKIRVDHADGGRKKNGRRVPLTKREELVAWLERKALGGGFEVKRDSLRTIPRGREYFFKPGTRGTHAAVEFQGELRVKSRAEFRATAATGIGSAKAFGFGLLVLAPIE